MEFRGDYAFLSNMNDSPITLTFGDKTYTFKCAESAFQACKCPRRADEFVNLNGVEARKLGRTVPLSSDWEANKVNVMYKVVFEKFNQNQFLRLRLGQVKGEIIEDTKYPPKAGTTEFWGRYNGVGENHLGIILMDVREWFNPFYCLVVGSRNFNDYQTMCHILDNMLQNKKYVVIVSGGAKGADSLAEQYAKDRGYRLKVMPANWDKYGKSAGYRRNEDMHLYISARHNRGIVGFWDEQSKGTAHNFELSKKYNNPMRCYNYIANQYVTI